MFCIINLRHNSRYVAPPAAGSPPFFSARAPPFKRDICVSTDLLIRDAAAREFAVRCIIEGTRCRHAKDVIAWKLRSDLPR